MSRLINTRAVNTTINETTASLPFSAHNSGYYEIMNDAEAPSSERATNYPGFLVVGVGASAGGLEAFMRLLKHIPRSTPLALVLVQHLARDQESLLPQLLAAQTELTIRDGTDGERIVAGHAYVIRPNTHMSVIDGHLRVQPRPPPRVNNLPIDHLFDSMAQQYGAHAIGVVLSGGGSDGAFGSQCIHAAGGITFAQEPEEAAVDSMPRAAIASGCISTVLNAGAIAEELVRMAQQPFYRESHEDSEQPLPGSAEGDWQGILRVLRRATGVDFTRYKTPTIRRRIQRRMTILHAHDLSAYLTLLVSSPDEAKHLHDDILIHVTSFFRDPESFEALNTTVLPHLLDLNRGDAPIRVWVPGCSSGEEVYSLAITLLDILHKHQSTTPILVFGTDLSPRMIERARAGLYSDNIAADVPAELLRRYFIKVDGGYRVSTEVRERCVFARQDITRDPPFSKLDLVMCRNVLIYLSQAAQRKVTEVFHYALLPHGILTLGRSETIGPLPELFSVIDGRWKIYRRKSSSMQPQRMDFEGQHLEPLAARSPPRTTTRERRERDFQTEANRILSERYAPPLAIIDDSFRVVRTQGHTAPFLELPSGDVSLDVMRMLRPGLVPAVRSALADVRKDGGTLRREGIEVRSQDAQLNVNVEVSRVGSPDNYHYLVLFEDTAFTSPDRELPLRTTGAAVPPTAIEHLQAELTEIRADLQAVIQELEAANEELQTANEEVLSSNEELQSTNEELDTAREELQATNEELGTVNDELQARNAELSGANGDLVNLLDSVDIPVVMVTSDLRIRRFTHAAERTLNLIPSDIGRPISHIKPNVNFTELEVALRGVIEGNAPREQEVRDHEGRSYRQVIRPYTNLANRVDGAVLALFDISESLPAARETGAALMATLSNPMLLLDSNFVVQRMNDAYCRMFDVATVPVQGQTVFELCDSRWNVPDLHELLEVLSPTQRKFENFALTSDCAGVGPKTVLVNGVWIGSGSREHGVILLAFREQVHA